MNKELQWKGDNFEEIRSFCLDAKLCEFSLLVLILKTRVGKQKLVPGDWIVQSPEGFYKKENYDTNTTSAKRKP